MTWQQIVALGIGAAVAVAGAAIPGAQLVLIPIGSTIVGGVLGNAQAQRKENKKS